MFTVSKPRYWIDWYDRWHLLLPLLLFGLIAGSWWTHLIAPRAELNRVASPRKPDSSSQPPAEMRPLVPTFIDAPAHGAGFTPRQLGRAEGRAEPGSTVHLFYLATEPSWRELGQTRADDTGHFRFQLANFPPGSYRLRARAQADSGLISDSNDVLITVVPDETPTKNPTRRVRRR